MFLDLHLKTEAKISKTDAIQKIIKLVQKHINVDDNYFVSSDGNLTYHDGSGHNSGADVARIATDEDLSAFSLMRILKDLKPKSEFLNIPVSLSGYAGKELRATLNDYSVEVILDALYSDMSDLGFSHSSITEKKLYELCDHKAISNNEWHAWQNS